MDKLLDYSIEFGHIYAEELLPSAQSSKENIAYTKMILSLFEDQGYSYSTSVLIDDYTLDTEVKIDKNAISNYFKKCGLTPDFIFLEGDFAVVAETIIETLPPKLLYKKDQKLFLSNQGDDLFYYEIPPRNRRHKSIFMKKINKIPLDKSKPTQDVKLAIRNRHQSITDTLLYVEAGKKRKYSCPLLATSWYLARLGLEPFSNVISKSLNDNKLFAKHLINILPYEYIRVESAVRDILYYSKDKKYHKAKKCIRYFFY